MESIIWEEDRCTEEGERLAEKGGRQINKQEKGRRKILVKQRKEEYLEVDR